MEYDLVCDFDEFLRREDFVWLDYIVEIASDILKNFTDSDWVMLAELTKLKPLHWQERCAEAAGSTQSEKAVPLLLWILNMAADEEVSIIAGSQLDDLEVDIPFMYKDRLLSLLSFMGKSIPGHIRRDDIQNLLNRLV